MTAKELLTPRFEVIADYPYNPHEIGAIIESEVGISSIHQTTIQYTDEFGENIKQQNLCTPSSFEKYPHLFRKLNWWEHRKVEDMPNKLVCKAMSNDYSIHFIEEWDLKNLFGYTDKSNWKGCGLLSFEPEYGYFPVD